MKQVFAVSLVLVIVACLDVQAQGGYYMNYSQGMHDMQAGKYDQAMNLLTQAWSEAQSDGHQSDLIGADILHQLGMCCYKSQDFASAEGYFERENQILSNTNADPDESNDMPTSEAAKSPLCYCLISLGDTRFALGDYSGARRNYRRALNLLSDMSSSYESSEAISKCKRMIAICEERSVSSQ